MSAAWCKHTQEGLGAGVFKADRCLLVWSGYKGLDSGETSRPSPERRSTSYRAVAVPKQRRL